jgi:hypothetical protein
MTTRLPLDLKRIRAEGFSVSVGPHVHSDTTLLLDSPAKIAAGLSNLPGLLPYKQIAISFLSGMLCLILSAAQVISNPQIWTGYHKPTGCPLLVGVKWAMEGLMTILGPTRSGKSSILALILWQLFRLGYPMMVIGLKSFEPLFAAMFKDGSEALTRIDGRTGELVGAPFEYCTLQPNLRTKGFNYHAQKGIFLPKWLEDSNLVQCLSSLADPNDPNQDYFRGSGFDLLQGLPERPVSFTDLHKRISRLKLNERKSYSTGGLRHKIGILAQIEQNNLSADDPFNINLARSYHRRGCVYVDVCFQDTGPVAPIVASLAAQAFVSNKRRNDPNPRHIAVLAIDEGQKFPRQHLKQLVEQVAGAGVRLITAYHDLSQLGAEDWPTIAMSQVRILNGAVPGSLTADHIQNLFGTTEEYVLSFSAGDNKTSSAGRTWGPVGESVTEGFAKGVQNGVTLTPRESPTCRLNDILDLNYDSRQFVYMVSPGAELSYHGPKALMAERGPLPLSWDRVNELAAKTLTDSPDTFVPGQPRPKLLSAAPIATDKRCAWVAILNETAEKIRKNL